MCGIFALLNNTMRSSVMLSNDFVKSQFEKGKHRGPEFSKLVDLYKIQLGFHRLSINGLNEKSNQPIIIDNITLICNGEIYNYKELYKEMNVTPDTDSDCEVIIHLYKKYGIEHTLQMLDGVFAFILLDNSLCEDLTNLTSKLYIARDTYGVCPLYYLKNKDNGICGFSSELKCLSEIFNTLIRYNKYESSILNQFNPSTYSMFHLSSKVNSLWVPVIENKPYIIPTFAYTRQIPQTNQSDYFNEIHKNIAFYLTNAVEKRCLTTERPIACLLSGGLDSSLITALVNDFYKKNFLNIPLETYSIGLEGSEDVKNARIVAEYLGTSHTEIIVTEKEMFEIIPEVIYNIESYDTTTVRASIGNYLLGKYISTHSSAKVIFNGDGSDELCGGYLYMNHCADNIEFDKETRRLLEDIYLFDVLRSDKSISSNGLEPRTPFLDKSFVNYYLSIPPYYRFHKNHGQMEKYLLRKSFSAQYFQNCEGNPLLPDEILWRKKEAFSDGVSSQKRSLFEILQEFILELDKDKHKLSDNLPKIEIEKTYYKSIFENHFPNLQSVLPYYWMPKYTTAQDPSARTLDIYKETSHE